VNKEHDWLEEARSSTDASVISVQGNICYPPLGWMEIDNFCSDNGLGES